MEGVGGIGKRAAVASKGPAARQGQVRPLRSPVEPRRSPRAEVAVECQRLPEALSPHDGEARGIDERVDALIVASEPGPRLALGRFLDMHDGEPGGRLDRREERDCRRMPVTTAQERPRLADDVVRRQDRQAGRPQPDSGLVVGITPEPKVGYDPLFDAETGTEVGTFACECFLVDVASTLYHCPGVTITLTRPRADRLRRGDRARSRQAANDRADHRRDRRVPGRCRDGHRQGARPRRRLRDHDYRVGARSSARRGKPSRFGDVAEVAGRDPIRLKR